ncbi:MAG: hypothetical protein R3D25_08950 [Geminicoccaceae bacterium]
MKSPSDQIVVSSVLVMKRLRICGKVTFWKHQHVVGGAVDAVDMHAAADDVRPETLVDHSPRGVEAERAGAVADVENHAALAGCEIGVAYPAPGHPGLVHLGRVAVGDDVAGAERVDDVLEARRRAAPICTMTGTSASGVVNIATEAGEPGPPAS